MQRFYVRFALNAGDRVLFHSPVPINARCFSKTKPRSAHVYRHENLQRGVGYHRTKRLASQNFMLLQSTRSCIAPGVNTLPLDRRVSLILSLNWPFKFTSRLAPKLPTSPGINTCFTLSRSPRKSRIVRKQALVYDVSTGTTIKGGRAGALDAPTTTSSRV